MIHVFNSPLDPTTMEFECAVEGDAVFDRDTKNKRRVTYNKDGRRLIDGEIEEKQKPSDLWTAALTRSMVSDLKERCDDRKSLRQTLREYVVYFNEEWQIRTSKNRVYVLVLINAALLAFFLYYFVV